MGDGPFGAAEVRNERLKISRGTNSEETFEVRSLEGDDNRIVFL
jgi:hypothetical protein